MPQIDEKRLQELADKSIYARTNEFNDYVLQTIGRRMKSTGKLSAYDQQALKNMADISGDMKAITTKLAEVTEQNIYDVERIYAQTLAEGVNSYKPLFDFKGMEFVPFEENEYAKFLVGHWAKETSEKMVNLSKTKALGFTDADGKFTPLQGAYQKCMDEAVEAISTGTIDFQTTLKKTVEYMGGSGVVVNYGNNITRRLDGAVRANLLYGAKQSAQAYDRYIGEKLGCDGFEVDYHSHPRPSHEFMGGKMYSYSGKTTIAGVTYEDGKEALERLEDYGCLHFKHDVILGISEPRYDQKQLERMKAQDKELIEYNGVKKTAYEWQQGARRLECETRKQRDIAHMAKESGAKTVERNANEKIAAYRTAYDDLCDKVGLEKRYNRMATFPSKSIDNVGESVSKSTIIVRKPIESVSKSTKMEIKPYTTKNSNDRDVLWEYLGRLDIEKYKDVTDKKIKTDDVILMKQRVQHIIEGNGRGQEFYETYKGYFPDIVSNPDYIFKDKKRKHTAIASKTFTENGETVHLVVRLVVEGESADYKNSIITAMRENDKRFKQRLRNNEPVYKRLDKNE